MISVAFGMCCWRMKELMLGTMMSSWPFTTRTGCLIFFNWVIAVRFGNHAPAGDSICLRPHSRHRRWDILVSTTVTTFPENPSGSLTRLARREEEMEKIRED